MAKNANFSDVTLPIRIGKERTIVERSAPKVIKKPKIIGNIKELKRPKIIGNIEEPIADRVIKIPKVAKVDDKCKRYVNSKTLSYVLRPTYLAALHKIKKKEEEWQQKIEKKINYEKSWFPLRKVLKNYTEPFGIKVINKSDQ